MFDYTQFTVKPEQIQDTVKKSKDIAIKFVEFQNAIAKETLDFFNNVTDKYFYTYTAKISEAVNQGSEYAKEFIQTGTVKAVSTNSGKH